MLISVHIVEDDPAVRDAAREVVAAQGRRVNTYDSPDEFFSRAEIGSRDIVVLDVHFPAGSGVEIAKRLRRDYPDVRIVVVSGIRLGRYAQAISAINPTASFRKPLDAVAFAECVNRLATT